mgnify:CR=1 FL=1
MNALGKLGFSMQLQHIPKETTYEQHGLVQVLNATTTRILSQRDQIQHNHANKGESKRTDEYDNMVLQIMSNYK